MREQIDYLIAWIRTRGPAARRGETGFTAVEWMFVVIGVIAIATIAIAAVKSYLNSEVNKLGQP